MKKQFGNHTLWQIGPNRITRSGRQDTGRVVATLALVAVFQLLPAGAAAATLRVPEQFRAMPSVVNAATTLRVPEQFRTIQSAVNAAHPGDTIKVAAGTFSEQVTIAKDLTLIGAGAGDDSTGSNDSSNRGSDDEVTTIKAPVILVPGPFGGRREIVTIMSGAKVTMSNLRIAGPGAEPCESPTSLSDGVLVVEDATLNMHSAAVIDIRGPSTSPDCPLVGAILIGMPAILSGGPATGHGTIAGVSVRGYGAFGISVTGPNSTATFSHNRVTGLGLVGHTATVGVSVGFGAAGTVLGNTVTNNLCDAPGCGPDPINQIQATGISVLFGSAGTVVAYNNISKNDVGTYLVLSPNCCSVHHNTLTDNRFFGDAILDGDNTISHDLISGGQVGVGIIANTINTTGTLRKVAISGASVVPVKELSCCGFMAKAVIK